jgi:hypothetical protein
MSDKSVSQRSTAFSSTGKKAKKETNRQTVIKSSGDYAPASVGGEQFRSRSNTVGFLANTAAGGDGDRSTTDEQFESLCATVIAAASLSTRHPASAAAVACPKK